MKYVVVDDLTKVFPQEKHNEFGSVEDAAIFRNESLNFQVAMQADQDGQKASFTAQCPGFDVQMYTVDLVPSEMPAYHMRHDDNYITREPGLFPDVLRPIQSMERMAVPGGQWRAIWLEITPIQDTSAGQYTVDIQCHDSDGNETDELHVTFDLLDMELPKQHLRYTRWFYCDCICHAHQVTFASEEFWQITRKYIRMAAQHGMNMILTPVFTPPLDTQIGSERLTTQLVAVEKKGSTYTFNFDLFHRWVDICLEEGIEYLEISHLFTQWGCLHAPKIMADVDGEYRRIFGWETDAFSDEYKEFMGAFLPCLTQEIERRGLKDHTYFHISDEPYEDHVENYKKAKAIVQPHIEGYTIIDALSNVQYYQEGIITKPIPAVNHIEPFIEEAIDGLWSYYCCSQCVDVSNIFMSMPSSRARIIAMQWYKYAIEGFLQWGYNFYNTQYSIRPINPYLVTDAGCGFPSGDAFVVYPAEKGCVPSLRIKVFQQALRDLRAMKMLEQRSGRDAVMDIIEGDLDTPITFSEYPHQADYIRNTRRRIVQAIQQSC